MTTSIVVKRSEATKIHLNFCHFLAAMPRDPGINLEETHHDWLLWLWTKILNIQLWRVQREKPRESCGVWIVETCFSTMPKYGEFLGDKRKYRVFFLDAGSVVCWLSETNGHRTPDIPKRHFSLEVNVEFTLEICVEPTMSLGDNVARHQYITSGN